MNVTERRESFLRTIAQLTDERAAARPIVESLRSSSAELWETEIPSSWRTAGFVQELAAAASEILEADPRESLALAQLALAIATSIPTETYDAPIQAQIEGAAWKEIGTAHRYLSEYDAALRAYDAAHRAFASATALAHDDAIVDFARAIALTDLGRHDEALELLAKAEPLLREFGDSRRLSQVAVLTGIVKYRQGCYEEARATYEKALRDVPLDEVHTRAILYGNIGSASADGGDLNNAVIMYNNARQLFAALDMPIELNRTEWNLARVLLATGEFYKALPILKHVREFFLDKGMPEEAGLAGLDVADVSIAIGAFEEAREVVSRVVTEFTTANLNTRALTALAYLRDVLPSTPQPGKTVRHVRQYLDQLRSGSASLFLPLDE